MHAPDWENPTLTEKELEVNLGKSLRFYRIHTKKLDQESLAARAGISAKTLRNFEMGKGSSLKTFILVLRALGRQSWLGTAAPDAFKPILVVKELKQRQRVYRPRKKIARPEP